MILLDMRTLVFSNVVTDILCMLVILLLWHQSRKRFAGTGFWVSDFAFQTAALFLIILRGSLPDWMSMVLSNTLVIGGAILGYMGLGRFVGKKISQVHNYVLLAAFACVHAYFALVQPNLAARNLNLAAGLLIICFQCMWFSVYRVEPGLRRLTFGVGLVFGGYCLVSLARIVGFFTVTRAASDYFQSGAFESLILISYQVLFILLTYSLVLMANKRLLLEVKTQEEKFAKAFHSSPYAITLTRLSDGQIIEVNDGFLNITGYQYAEAIGKSTVDLHLWDREEDRVAAVNELSKSGKVRGREFQFRKKSGEMITGLFSADIIPINDQQFVLSSISDITDRKRAEIALRESEQRWATTLASIGDAIIATDVGGKIIFMNVVAEELTGWTLREASMKPVVGVFNIVNEQNRQKVESPVTKVLQKGNIVGLANHTVLVRKDGTEVPIDDSGAPIKDLNGKTTGVVLVFRDITERKKAEQALRESEARANALIKYAPTGIYEIDYRGPSFISLNDAMCQILGYSREELFSIGPSALLDDNGRALFADRIRRQLAGEKAEESVEYRVRKKDGSLIDAILNVSLNPGGGGPGRALVVAYDITERKRMEGELRRSRDELEIRVQERTAELARANKELQEEMAKREKAEQQLLQTQKLESIGTLAGGIAHDFNNILGAIVINSEMALFDLPKGSGLRSNLELILKSGIRGKDLVRQMLLFSRKSEKKQEIITLTPLIKETFKLLRSSLPTTIQMKLLLETESDSVSADPSQIQQVIMNLCTNAAYAMRGTTGSIDISLQGITFGLTDLPEADMQPGHYLVLSVKDTGSGMDEEVKKRIFEPFFTTKPVGEGTGLGLSVAYGIVKNHKGNITVYSEPGRGSIFRVYLPKADTGVSVQTETPRPIPKGNERILLVDDEEIIVNSVRNMLQHLGYQVTAVMDSQEALKIFSADSSQFDLVMTDQTMPFMTGEDLGKELMRIRPDIPIILCTGYSDMISSEKATAMGFRGFIMKPFTVREGAELVRWVLDQNSSK